MTTRSLIIGHRGHSVGAPENTMAAFREAARRGADMIEADVHRTVDGALVLLHDATVDRTTSGPGPVAELTLAAVKRLDAGSWFSAAYTGERVPELGELLDFATTAGVALCLEAKGETADQQQTVAMAIAGAIAARGRLDIDVLASFDHDALAAAVSAVAGVRPAPDRLPERGPSSAGAILDQVHRCGARIVQHHHRDLRPTIVDALHAAGVAVWAWPTTTAEEIDRALTMRVDAVMGDDVTTAVERLALRQ